MLDRRELIAAAIAGLGLAGSGLAHADDGAIPAFLPHGLAETLDALTTVSGTVGGMVAAAQHGKLVAFHAWGQAALDPARPITPDTLFHVGSNGKYVTAIAVLQLVQAGKLTLDDPLGRHLPDLPALLAETTVYQLLHQTSGLPDYLDAVTDWSLPVSRQMVFDAVKPGRVFAPGAAWAYSNTNYFVLGWLIEGLSGMTYADYVSARIFRPARMPNARADSSVETIPNRAVAYTRTGNAVAPADLMEDAMSRAADGGVLLSARDIAPLAVVMADDGLLAGGARGQLYAPASLTTGRAVPYGCGVYMEECRRAAFHHHLGGVPGFVSQRMAFGGSGVQVWAVSNTDGNIKLPLAKLALTMAEGIAPGSTYLSLPLLPADARTAILRAALKGNRQLLPGALMAPELAAAGGGGTPRWTIGPDHLFAPVESWRGVGGDYVRYRWVGEGDEVGHLVIGWTPDDRIFWIF